MYNRRIAAFVSVFAASLVLAGCGSVTTPVVQNTPEAMPTNMPTGGTPPKTGGMQPQTPPAITETQQAQLDAGAATHEPKTLTFDVTGGSFYYVPNQIRVKKGDTVKIIFHNAGGMHNFVLDEFNVKIDTIKGGEDASAEFVVDKAGTFEYYCSVGNHRAMGQKGQLIVE
ncbi:cupredoxin domain-containing protein [Patescibacteria group bacterium]|nr:cupredoxin domain-containing protein [Patescibacteria group bacterium]